MNRKSHVCFMLLFVSLLFCAICAAQNSSQENGSAAQAPSTAAGNSNPVTIEGCLTGSAGPFILVDNKTGTSYILHGHSSELAENTNHQVEVSGQVLSGAGQSETSSTTDAAARTGNNLNVSSVRKVADQCRKPPTR